MLLFTLVSSGCEPSLESSNPKDRAIAVTRLENQEELAVIAVSDEAPTVRRFAARRLVNQDLLTRIAILDYDQQVGQAAVEKIQDQRALAEICLTAKNSQTRIDAATKLTNQTILAEIVVDYIGSGRSDVGEIALSNLELVVFTNQTLLARVVSNIKDPEVRRVASDKIKRFEGKTLVENSQSVNEFPSKDNFWHREFALNRINSENLIRKTALRNLSRWGVSKLNLVSFIMTVFNEEFLMALVKRKHHAAVKATAILLMENQDELRKIADKDPSAMYREFATVGILDEQFLLDRARLDQSPSVRSTIVRTLKTQDAILSAAAESYYSDVREAAIGRILGSAQNSLESQPPGRYGLLPSEPAKYQVDLPKRVLNSQAKIESLIQSLAATSQSNLVSLAKSAKYDVVCRSAAERITDARLLMGLILESSDREVIKTAFSRLDDEELLTEIADSSEVPSDVSLAACCKIGRLTWREVFNQSFNDPTALGNALGAVSMFDRAQEEAKEHVEATCIALIRRSDESRIGEMVDLLEVYGSQQLAEDFLNCGQSDLSMAARSWASKRGYTIGTGRGSSRATWNRR